MVTKSDICDVLKYCIDRVIAATAIIGANYLAYVYDGEFLKIVMGADLLIIGAILKISFSPLKKE